MNSVLRATKMNASTVISVVTVWDATLYSAPFFRIRGQKCMMWWHFKMNSRPRFVSTSARRQENLMSSDGMSVRVTEENHPMVENSWKSKQRKMRFHDERRGGNERPRKVRKREEWSKWNVEGGRTEEPLFKRSRRSFRPHACSRPGSVVNAWNL